jgi:nucleoside-diphosphate-sugar epimerase
VLVTGASGVMGLPLAGALARDNEVFAAARFSDPATRDRVAAAGAHPVTLDVAGEYDALPRDIDVIFHCVAYRETDAPGNPSAVFEVNAVSAGRLISHCREASAFVYCSSAATYGPKGDRPMREDEEVGLLIPTYSASKIAGEQITRFASREFGVPATVLRIFSLYSPSGGGPTQRVGLVAEGKEVPVSTNGTTFSLIYETDYVALAIQSVELADTPPAVVNFAGSEPCTVEEYCGYAGELLGVQPRFAYSDSVIPGIYADVTLQHRLLGPTTVGWREGIRCVVEARYPGRVRR